MRPSRLSDRVPTGNGHCDPTFETQGEKHLGRPRRLRADAFDEYCTRRVLRLEDERIVTGRRFLAQATI
ncbi:MAG: hypothetical protein ACR2PA_00545 [Hyphomicrobiaceae bacterium]